jgi:hypothetical protein
MTVFVVRGSIRDAETDAGLSGLFVKAYDKDLLFDDLMGTAFTAQDGRFEIISGATDFRDFFEKHPDIYLKVYAADRLSLLHTTRKGIRWNAASPVEFDVRIRRPKPARKLRLISGLEERDSFDPGESLAIAATGLRPVTAHEVVVRADDGRDLFTARLVTDVLGAIPETVIWGQIGLDDPAASEPLTIEEARTRWGGRTLTVTVLEQGKPRLEANVRIPSVFQRPLVLNTDGAGRIVNGFEVGDRPVIVSLRNLPGSETVGAHIYMVPHQAAWHPGDAIVPAPLTNGGPAMATVELTAGARDIDVRLADAQLLLPGAYDFVVRPIRYGYEDDLMWLTVRDLVAQRNTGLVVREPFLASKVVLGGCVNLQHIAGRSISGPPYSKYTDVFQVGEDVWAALDPAALDPSLIGKMVALYLIEHKSVVQWGIDSTLQHLPVLGGNAAVPKFLTQSYCINANRVLIWPGANDVGEYDIIADFGNNTANAGSFAPDDSFDTPLDIIDGYMVPGFRVVPDPAVDTSFAHAGTFQYDQTTQGTIPVLDDFGTLWSVPLRAVVYFPSDVSGATTPAQISGAQSDYPLVVIVHGNSSALTSYLGYNYLLEHLARNGFVAVSVHLEPDMFATDRARVMFAHIDIIKNMFGTALQNNIGIMGHSRGGEAVVVAARLNQQNALGHGLNAVISLAPTSWIVNPTLGGAWAKPYLVIYGSMDGDVAGISDTGFELYDRANGASKSMVFVYGSTHGRYNTVWGDTDITAPWSSLGPTDMPRLINADAHQKIALGYMSAFFRLHLRAESQWEGIFKGDWVPAAVQAADAGKVKLYVQHENATHREVDNFEGAHTSTSWQTSTIGAAVGQTGLPSTPQEAQTFTDPHAPHETGALFVRWDHTSDALQFDIPVGQRDVTAYTALSFRIGQKVGGSNPANLSQSLRATLRDGSGNQRAVRVSKFVEIPPPHVRDNNFYTKTAMNTVRIPLRSYIIRCAGMPEVDLGDVVSISFEFSDSPTGEVVIDSVEFTV